MYAPIKTPYLLNTYEFWSTISVLKLTYQYTLETNFRMITTVITKGKIPYSIGIE